MLYGEFQVEAAVIEDWDPQDVNPGGSALTGAEAHETASISSNSASPRRVRHAYKAVRSRSRHPPVGSDEGEASSIIIARPPFSCFLAW